MITAKECLAKFGSPKNGHLDYMIVWNVPEKLRLSKVIPKRIYCNTLMINPLTKAFENLNITGAYKELKTWDGCYNVRKVRGGTAWSLHSWAIAIDVNAAENGLNMIPKLSSKFVQCFKDAGFDWGGDFKRKDGMHFQLAKI